MPLMFVFYRLHEFILSCHILVISFHPFGAIPHPNVLTSINRKSTGGRSLTCMPHKCPSIEASKGVACVGREAPPGWLALVALLSMAVQFPSALMNVRGMCAYPRIAKRFIVILPDLLSATLTHKKHNHDRTDTCKKSDRPRIFQGKTEWDSSRQLSSVSKKLQCRNTGQKISPDQLTTQQTKTMVGIAILILSTKFPGTGLKLCGLSAVSALLRQKCTWTCNTQQPPLILGHNAPSITFLNKQMNMQKNRGHMSNIEYPKGWNRKLCTAGSTLKPTLQLLRRNNMETRPIFQRPGAWRSRNANFAVGDYCMLCDLHLNSRNCKIGSVQKVFIFCLASLNRAQGARFWLQTWTKNISCPVLASSQRPWKRQMTDEPSSDSKC